MNRRDLIALIGAVAFTIVLMTLVYLFFDRLWHQLSPWVAVPLSVLAAVMAIGSPIYTLLKISDRMLERQQREAKHGDHRAQSGCDQR